MTGPEVYPEPAVESMATDPSNATPTSDLVLPVADVPVTAHTPQLAELDPRLHQVAVDVAVELAYVQGRGDGYRNGYRDGQAAGRAFRSRVELDATRRLHDALTGDYRSGARARDDRLLDSLRSTGIIPAMAA